MKRLSLVLLCLLLAMLTSCAHVISEEVRKTAETEVTFAQVFENPDQYIGRTFIWGGFIVMGSHMEEGTYLEIVQNPTNKYGEITNTDRSRGRFLAFTPGFLEPMIYEKGRLITVAGELTGTKEGKRNEQPYIYPVLTIKESHLWRHKDYEEPDPWARGYPPYWWYDPWPYWPYGPYGPPPR